METGACDITHPMNAPEAWVEPDVLVHCASSGRGGPDAYRAVYRDGLCHLLEAFRPRLAIFVGSSSVYAQTDGSWVDENSPAQPTTETGHILLEAESLALSAGGTVLRLSGIYGPHRSVLLRKYREGSAVLEEGGSRWINQVHRDDGASAIVHIARLGIAGLFNVCDNHPATQRDVYTWIATHLGGPLPPEGPAALPRKRGNSNKRVSNSKLRATGWEPRYPSYLSALEAQAV
ncbi:MAG: SDR family oxidoreductase [Terrimicrobiaceae bacterium]